MIFQVLYALICTACKSLNIWIFFDFLMQHIAFSSKYLSKFLFTLEFRLTEFLSVNRAD